MLELVVGAFDDACYVEYFEACLVRLMYEQCSKGFVRMLCMFWGNHVNSFDNDFLLNYVFFVTVLMYIKMFRTLFYLLMFKLCHVCLNNLMVVFSITGGLSRTAFGDRSGL